MNFFKVFFIGILAVFILGFSQAFAVSQNVDQNYLPGDTGVSRGIPATNYTLGQSFKPDLNRITRIDIDTKSIALETVVLTLADSNNNFITSKTITSDQGFLTFNFSSPVEVTSGAEYRIFLSSPNGLTDKQEWQESDPGGYSQGTAIISGNPATGKDFHFRTWGYNIVQETPSDPSVLEPPTNLEALDVPDDQGKAVELKWQNTVTENYSGYNIYRANKVENDTSGIRSWLLAGTVSRGAEEFTDEEGLDPNKTYYYIVRTYKENFESENSNEVEISPQDNLAPNAPKNLQIINSGKGWVELSWGTNLENDLDGYVIDYGKDSADLNQSQEVDKNTVQLKIEKLSRGKNYYFIVKAKDASGNLSPVSNRVSKYIEGVNWVWYLLIVLFILACTALYIYFANKKRLWPFKKKTIADLIKEGFNSDEDDVDKKSTDDIIKEDKNPSTKLGVKEKNMAEKKIGKVTHFFGKIGVGIIKVDGSLKVGDKIKVKGATSDFEQEVSSMQIDHKEIEAAKKGDEVGIKLDEKVREGDEVFTVAE